MAGVASVAWAPAPIRTERLGLREPQARDRAAAIELFASPEVGVYIGGPRPRDELERAVPEVPGRRPQLGIRTRSVPDLHSSPCRTTRKGQGKSGRDSRPTS